MRVPVIEALFTLALGERGLDHREPVDLHAVTGAVVEACRTEARQLDVRVDTAFAPTVVPRLVERRVINLVDNAIRHNVPGGRLCVDTTGTTRDGHGLGLAIAATHHARIDTRTHRRAGDHHVLPSRSVATPSP